MSIVLKFIAISTVLSFIVYSGWYIYRCNMLSFIIEKMYNAAKCYERIGDETEDYKEKLIAYSKASGLIEAASIILDEMK